MIIRIAITAAAILLAASASIAQDAAAPSPVAEAVYTSMEEVYFDADAGREPAPWLGLRMAGDMPEAVDAFGDPAPLPADLEIVSRTPDRLTVAFAGRTSELRRARPATCWAMIEKGTKPDGSIDYHAQFRLETHDQGGRLSVGGGDSGAPETILRIRRVTWPEGSPNRPSLVLYILKPNAPDHAVSYSWADIDAKFVGINLRWVQASCTIEPAEPTG